MSVRANFVPLARLRDQERRRRGARWLIADVGVLFALVVIWGVEQTANHGLSRRSNSSVPRSPGAAQLSRPRND
jgi:hypothetical protein